MFLRRLKRGIAGFRAATTLGLGQQISLLILLTLISVGVITVTVEGLTQAYNGYRFNHLSSAEHLSQAKDVCGPNATGICASPDDALRHLEKIPITAPEHGEASKIALSIQQQKQRNSEEVKQKTAESEEQSRKQMLRNVQGVAHDNFSCRVLADNKLISLPPGYALEEPSTAVSMSFDGGQHWWADDGRCAALPAEVQAAKQKAEQGQRDADAKLYSYWPTTVRVDTDMDSFWLDGEERTCQTYPDAKGRVAVVACNAAGSHRDHNIPVEFWGGVGRNTVSDWKCTRVKNVLSDHFVCYAMD